MLKTYLRALPVLLMMAAIPVYSASAQNAKIDNTQTPIRTSPAIAQIEVTVANADHESANIVSFNLAPLQVELDKEQKQFLMTHAVTILRNTPDIKLVIQSLARSNPKDRYEKTRIALARGLEVRQYFIDQGISPKRVKIEPLPTDGSRGEDDRIDLVFTQ